MAKPSPHSSRYQRVHADDFAVNVADAAAAVSRIDRCVGLDVSEME